jgi:hypothetical protein
MSSGDFTHQSETPQPIDIDAMVRVAGSAALDDLSMAGMPAWPELPFDLSRLAIEILVQRLIESGQRDMTVLNLAVLLGITYEDGSWT